MGNVAEKLIEAREKLNKSQIDVCRDLNIPQSTLSNYEQGTRIPKDDMKVILAKYYNTSVEALFFSL